MLVTEYTEGEVVTADNIEFAVNFMPLNDSTVRYAVVWYLGTTEILHRYSVPVQKDGNYNDSVKVHLNTKYIKTKDLTRKVSEFGLLIL